MIEFDDWWQGEPDEAGDLLFDKRCGVMSFAMAVYKGTGEWLAAPEREYPAKIRTDFPAYERLGDVLRRYDCTGPPCPLNGRLNLSCSRERRR